MANDFVRISRYTNSARTAKKFKLAEMAEEVICMNKHAIIQKLTDDICTRQHILHAARIVDPSFKETQLRYLMKPYRILN